MKNFIVMMVFVFIITNVCFSQIKQPQSELPISQKEIKIMIVYGSDTCHYCLDTKSFLKENKKAFVYYDVDVNMDKQKEMILKLQKSGISLDNISLPIVEINGILIMNDVDNFQGFLNILISKK
ncbi:glutaredoxin family protein [Gaetbulibacter saemankumensis]|uniref:glutaredoxin family protein n=1 Tax=Gaetbulibacter saemankumensis TaxID=311208 RepID=UPI000551C67F|nr:glutaredoxin [Gaetbulibacter saemankumensis]